MKNRKQKIKKTIKEGKDDEGGKGGKGRGKREMIWHFRKYEDKCD